MIGCLCVHILLNSFHLCISAMCVWLFIGFVAVLTCWVSCDVGPLLVLFCHCVAVVLGEHSDWSMCWWGTVLGKGETNPIIVLWWAVCLPIVLHALSAEYADIPLSVCMTLKVCTSLEGICMYICAYIHTYVRMYVLCVYEHNVIRWITSEASVCIQCMYMHTYIRTCVHTCNS
jgi:hypothetical protein